MTQNFIKSQDYLEMKQYLLSSFVDKPLSIKTEGKDDRAIAIEVRASQLACDKLIKGFKKFERTIEPKKIAIQPFR